MIEHMCVISTAHVTKDVAEALDFYTENNLSPKGDEWADALVVYQHGEHGWLIYIQSDVDVSYVPKSLVDCMALARANGCSWLLLDNGAGTVTNIPTFEW